MKRKKIIMAWALLATVFLPTMGEAGNLQKKYIHLSKDGNQATASDLGNLYAGGQMQTNLSRLVYDVAQGRIPQTTGNAAWAADPVNSEESAIQINGNNGSGRIIVDNLPVNMTYQAKNSVEFWMYWKGTDNVMPLSWYGNDTGGDLWFYNNSFGFNSNESNVMGIASTELKNKWVHVVAVFVNGIPYSQKQHELYINGVKQTLSERMSYLSNSPRTVQPRLYIGGWIGNGNYQFDGYLKQFRVYNRGLTTEEVSNHYKGNMDLRDPSLILNIERGS